MFRGSTVYLIYNRTLLLKEGVYDESAAVSLMSNDVDRIAFCLTELNECWSRCIEIAIGLTLLSIQLGWVSLVPLVVIACKCTPQPHMPRLIFAVCTFGSSVVTKRIGNIQKVWADATQRRIATTSSMLRDMKTVKMMGLSNVMGDIVQGERITETKRMESRAWIIVWQNVIGMFILLNHYQC